MDFPAPSPSRYKTFRAEERSWRKAAIVVGAIAALELIVLLVITLAFIAKPFADGASSHARQAAEGDAALLARTKTPVLVLNGNGVAGSAGTTARRIRELEYPVVGVADASRRTFGRTLVMYREDARTAAVRLAKDLGFTARRAVPLDGLRNADLHGAQLAVVVGRRG